MLCEVPQGSVLGPLLFLVYINDIEQRELSSKVADDTSLTTSSPDLMTLEFKLNSDLEKIQNWLHSNKLTLNVKKTKYAIIGSCYKLNNLNHDFIVSVDNREIERVTSYKYIGVEIDKTLSWRNHTDSLCKKVSAGIGAIKRVRHLVPSQNLHQMYDALEEPYLEYYCEVWGCMGLCQCDRLQKLQNRAARVITTCEDYSLY